MLLKRCLGVVIASLCWVNAQAGLKVLDVELGASTVDQVRKAAATTGKVQNAGTSTWTQGPILLVDNPDVGIEGVKSMTYVFDGAGKLAAISLNMHARKAMDDLKKSRFAEVASNLASKYKLVKQVRPFVGNQYAKYSAPDTVIELDAPHLSFDMELRYMTSGFFKAMNEGAGQQEQQKRSQEKARL